MTGTPPSITSTDALGVALVWAEARAVDGEFRQDDATRALEYWNNMQEFHGISETDVQELPLDEVAEKYAFPLESGEYIRRHDLGRRTLGFAQKSASYGASRDLSYEKGFLANDVEKLRGELRKTTGDNRARAALDADLDACATLPPAFNEWRTDANGATRVPWHEWLTDKASPEQFMNFVQWHNYRMKALNDDPTVIDAITREKAQYKEVLELFASQDVMQVSSRTLSELDAVKVVVADVFGTAMQGLEGYYPYQPNHNIRYVAVAEESIGMATKHELNHAVLGSFKDRWLNEAATEHINIAIGNRVMHQADEFLSEGTYIEERKLLQVVMDRGAEVIPMKLLLNGYTEQKFTTSRDQFDLAVEQSWGSGALRKVAAALESYEDQLVKSGRSTRGARVVAVQWVCLELLRQPEKVLGKAHIRP